VTRELRCLEVRSALTELGDTNEVIAMRACGFWIVIFIQWTALELFAQTNRPLPLEIYVYNPVRVPQAILSRAEQRVSAILGRSGVEAEWLDCSAIGPERGRCAGLPAPGSVTVQIVQGTTKMSEEVFGATFLGTDGTGRQADIFYDRINALHEDWNIALAELLGNVIAHELGHLLLGLNAHSPTGIMSPVWTHKELSQAQRGALVFSVEQSKRIQKKLGDFASASPQRPSSGN